MKKILLLSLILFPSIAMAQEPPKQFTLTVTQEDLQVIGSALEALPFKQAAPLIQKFNQQIQSQVRPPVPLPAPKPEEEKK